MNTKYIYSFVILFLFGSYAAADTKIKTYENLTKLLLESEKFIKNSHLDSEYPVSIKIKPISKRMKLVQCEHPINYQYSNETKTSGNTLLKVSCSSPVKWRFHLPVSITLYHDVLVLNKPVIRGQSIDEEDVRVKKIDAKYLTKGFYTHVDQLRLLESKRNLKKDIILSPSHLKHKQLIKSGQQVTLLVEDMGIAIKASGTALQSASKGQLIKVRNNSSLKTVEGIVIRNGLVKINL